LKATGIILAGGKNLRYGKIKALETIGGRTVIQRVLDSLRPLIGQILIVTGANRIDLPGTEEAEFVTDIYPHYGPLGGIYTGLVSARFPLSIVVASDMPFINTRLLRYMLEQAGDSDAVVPLLEGGMVEALHAVYSKNCLEMLKKRLDNKQLSSFSFVKALKTRYIEPAEIQQFDPKLLSLFSINVPADIEKARNLESNLKSN
jgi:molybdenum cofactor guanylyltransferase